MCYQYNKRSICQKVLEKRRSPLFFSYLAYKPRLSLFLDFERLCYNIAQHEAHHIPSPAHQKRRAAVAAIVRWHNKETKESTPVNSLDDFFKQDWLKKGEAQLLFMQRATRVGDRYEEASK